MVPFNIEGLEKARMSLTQLAKTPSGRSTSTVLTQKIIASLYTEIRAARIAGHPWKAIAAAISADIKTKISTDNLANIFNQLDKQYEAETGVSALGTEDRRSRRRRKKGEAE